MTAALRELTAVEREILDLLLRDPFPGRDQLREQLDSARVRRIDEYDDNYGSVEFVVDHARPAPVTAYMVAEAGTEDEDGVPVEVLLHVRDGVLRELEVVKADGSPLIRSLRAEELKLAQRDEAASRRGRS